MTHPSPVATPLAKRRLVALVLGLVGILGWRTAEAQASRPLHYGYYYVGGKWQNPGEDHFAEVCDYTNTFLVSRNMFDSGDPHWDCKARDAAERAAAAGKRLILQLDLPKTQDAEPADSLPYVEQYLDAVAGAWDAVDLIEVADEPEWINAVRIDEWLDMVKGAIEARFSNVPPLGASFKRQQIMEMNDPFPNGNRVTKSRLAWVGLTAYVDPNQSTPDPAGTLQALRQNYWEQVPKVGGKPRMVIMQSYDRNGCFTRLEQLPAIQRETFDMTLEDSGAIALTMFAYSRYGTGSGCTCGAVCGGARLRSDVIPVHREIAQSIPGPGSYDCPSGGPNPGPCGTTTQTQPPQNLRVGAIHNVAELSWTHSGPAATYFSIWQYHTDGGWRDMKHAGSGERSASLTVGVPQNPGVYRDHRFMVKAHFGDGNPKESEEVVARFFGFPPSSAPVPISPAGCIPTLRPTLRWQPVADATSYYVVVTRWVDGQPVDSDFDVFSTEYLLGTVLEPNVRYGWRVKPCNNYECAPLWSPFTMVTPLCSPKADFNADGGTDILFRDQVTGNHELWFLSGDVRSGSAPLVPAKPAAPNWRLAGSADFDRDGKADLLWQNTTSGNLSFWLMNGATNRSGALLTGPADLALSVVGTGDFNRDGFPDIVFRRSGTDQLRVWFLQGTAKVGEADVVTNPEWGSYASWILEGVGDLNDDAMPDFVWRNPANGQLVIWNMNGVVNIAPGVLTPSSLPDLAWSLVTIADVDRDGAQDLVWQHQGSASLVVWHMNGVVRRDGGYLTPSKPENLDLRAIGPR